jgi:hypothetical protein
VEYLLPFLRHQEHFPMVLLVRSSELVDLRLSAPFYYVDDVLLSEAHGQVLWIMDGGTESAAYFPPGIQLATVTHGSFTMPAADPYFWAAGYTFYDYIFLSGTGSHRSIAEGLHRFCTEHPEAWDTKPGLRRRRDRLYLVPTGHSKIDSLLKMALPAPTVPTVTFAPTEPMSLPAGTAAFPHSVEIVEQLLEYFPEHRVVFRPYPSGKNAAPAVKTRETFLSHPRFFFDDGNRSTTEVYASTSVYLTDASTGGFSFLAAARRPAFFLLPSSSDPILTRFAQDCATHAFVVQSISQMRAVWERAETASVFAKRGARFAQENLYHPGRSHERLNEILGSLTTGHHPQDWECVHLR